MTDGFRIVIGFGWTRRLVGMLLVLVASNGLAPGTVSAQQTCDDFNECTVVDTCQADGSCKGTPKPDGTACNDGNECTTNDHCQAGHCVQGGVVANGTPCTSMLGPCMTNAHCLVQFGFAACIGDFVECPDDGNKCTLEVCDPRTGGCLTIANTCAEDCSTATCDPATGDCVNPQPKADGLACDDFNECTSNDRCQAGECRGGGGVVATATPTATPEVTSPPKASRTPTATATPVTTPAVIPCVGDCNGDGEVTIDELIKGVNIALGTAPIDNCPEFDVNGDAEVTVDELIKGVNAALAGCTPVEGSPTPNTPVPTNTEGAGPTRTPSVTPTATLPGVATATASVTPALHGPTPTSTTTTGIGGVARRAGGTIESTTTVFRVIPQVLSALLGHVGSFGGGSGAVQIISLPFSCPGGGGGTASCDQTIVPGFPPTFGPPAFTVVLNNCAVSGNGGATLTFNGTLTATGQDGDSCFSVPSNLTLATTNLSIASQTAAGSTTATFSNFSAAATLSCSGGSCQCTYDNVALQLTGTIAVEAKDSMGTTLSTSQATFGEGSTIGITVDRYTDQCVPVIYTMTVDGTIVVSTNGSSFEGMYAGYTLHDDATSGEDAIDLSGAITSACFGGTVSLSTRASLLIADSATCPQAGEIVVSFAAVDDLLRYTAGGLEIDLGDDGSVDGTFACADPRLFVCPGS